MSALCLRAYLEVQVLAENGFTAKWQAPKDMQEVPQQDLGGVIENLTSDDSNAHALLFLFQRQLREKDGEGSRHVLLHIGVSANPNLAFQFGCLVVVALLRRGVPRLYKPRKCGRC
jgi:hypothetical protein